MEPESGPISGLSLRSAIQLRGAARSSQGAHQQLRSTIRAICVPTCSFRVRGIRSMSFQAYLVRNLSNMIGFGAREHPDQWTDHPISNPAARSSQGADIRQGLHQRHQLRSAIPYPISDPIMGRSSDQRSDSGRHGLAQFRSTIPAPISDPSSKKLAR